MAGIEKLRLLVGLHAAQAAGPKGAGAQALHGLAGAAHHQAGVRQGSAVERQVVPGRNCEHLQHAWPSCCLAACGERGLPRGQRFCRLSCDTLCLTLLDAARETEFLVGCEERGLSRASLACECSVLGGHGYALQGAGEAEECSGRSLSLSQKATGHMNFGERKSARSGNFRARGGRKTGRGRSGRRGAWSERGAPSRKLGSKGSITGVICSGQVPDIPGHSRTFPDISGHVLTCPSFFNENDKNSGHMRMSSNVRECPELIYSLWIALASPTASPAPSARYASRVAEDAEAGKGDQRRREKRERERERQRERKRERERERQTDRQKQRQSDSWKARQRKTERQREETQVSALHFCSASLEVRPCCFSRSPALAWRQRPATCACARRSQQEVCPVLRLGPARAIRAHTALRKAAGPRLPARCLPGTERGPPRCPVSGPERARAPQRSVPASCVWLPAASCFAWPGIGRPARQRVLVRRLVFHRQTHVLWRWNTCVQEVIELLAALGPQLPELPVRRPLRLHRFRARYTSVSAALPRSMAGALAAKPIQSAFCSGKAIRLQGDVLQPLLFALGSLQKAY